jgi:cobalt-zinc-cadmium efflux system outer membrane protein
MTARYNRWQRHAGVGALALALSLAALAGEPVPPAAKLADAVEQAWRLHPQAAALGARDAQAQATHELASGLTPAPASVSLGHLTDRPGRNLGRQEWEVEVAAPLWLPGQKDAQLAEADSRIGEAAARRAALRLELAGEVREAWWSLAGARSAQALARQRLETARALDSDVQKRLRVGELSRMDANLAQGEVLAAEAELIASDAALAQQEQVFQVLSGSSAPSDLDAETAAPLPGAQDKAASSEHHPQLALAAAAARGARARVKLADETRRSAPELAVRMVYERGDSSESYANTVGVRLKIPLSSGAQVRRDSSAAQAEAAAADAELRRAEIRVQLEVERAQRALAAAERQVAMAQERRALAADNLRLSEKAFALGESDLATLLRVRAAANDAQSLHERQRIELSAAISRLNQALGVLP